MTKSVLKLALNSNTNRNPCPSPVRCNTDKHDFDIPGLDPAGPSFSNYDTIVHLDPTDALYVDVIHSDGAPLQDAGMCRD